MMLGKKWLAIFTFMLGLSFFAIPTVDAAEAEKDATTKKIEQVIEAGEPHLGTPYTWAGRTPNGFDCSGFVNWAFAQADVSVGSSTSVLQNQGERVSVSDMKPGDLVFFDTYKKNGHVGIYVGDNKFIGSQNSTGLAVADMSRGYWKSKFNNHVRRVIN